MNLSGYVRLHRKVQKNPTWTQCAPCVFKFLAYCMMQANWEPSVWYDGTKEQQLPAGSFVSTLRAMSDTCNLSIKQVRSSIVDLEKLEIISVIVTAKVHVVTVINYQPYQSSEELEKSTGCGNNTSKRAQAGHDEGTNGAQTCGKLRYEEAVSIPELSSLKPNTDKRTNVVVRSYLQDSDQSVRAFVEQKDCLRRGLSAYFEGRMGEPDEDLVLRVFKAGQGASAEEICEMLRYRYQHGQSPRDPNGPEGWGWFPTVVRRHFSKAKGAVA